MPPKEASKRLLKFSSAKGTRPAPLPVIGLAPFPQNSLRPVNTISYIPAPVPTSSLHLLPLSLFMLLYIHLCFLRFAGAWRSRRDSVVQYKALRGFIEEEGLRGLCRKQPLRCGQWGKHLHLASPCTMQLSRRRRRQEGGIEISSAYNKTTMTVLRGAGRLCKTVGLWVAPGRQ